MTEPANAADGVCSNAAVFLTETLTKRRFAGRNATVMSQARTVLGVFLLLLALTGLGQDGWLDYLHQSADDISASDDSSPANDDAANFSVTGLEIPFLQKRMIIQAPVFFQVKELAVVAGENFHSAPPSPAPGFIASYQSVFVLRPGLLPGAPSLA